MPTVPTELRVLKVLRVPLELMEQKVLRVQLVPMVLRDK